MKYRSYTDLHVFYKGYGEYILRQIRLVSSSKKLKKIGGFTSQPSPGLCSEPSGEFTTSHPHPPTALSNPLKQPLFLTFSLNPDLGETIEARGDAFYSVLTRIRKGWSKEIYCLS